MHRIAFVTTLLAAMPVWAATLTEQYELQERCGERAEEVFRGAWGPDGVKSGIRATYRNHYNTRLNKCFYLLTTTSSTMTREILFDIHEMRDYGMLSTNDGRSSCTLLGKPCASKEWEILIRPYMEDEDRRWARDVCH